MKKKSMHRGKIVLSLADLEISYIENKLASKISIAFILAGLTLITLGITSVYAQRPPSVSYCIRESIPLHILEGRVINPKYK
jgi:hypothetical protein